MSISSTASLRDGTTNALADMNAAAAAKQDVTNVAIFTKFIKHAEDNAQAAL